jgi:hypothetical protein
MKKQKFILFPLILISLALLYWSCSEDVIGVPGIDESLPEITSIEASETRIIAGNSVEVSVTAKSGNTYAWSAESGTFSDATATTTTWTSPDFEETSTVKLICTVTNSNGSRQASISVSAVVLTVPVAHWTFDNDKIDIMDQQLEAVGDQVTINTTDAHIGDGCASFIGAIPYDFDSSRVLLVPEGDSLKLDAESDYTIMMWIKTDSLLDGGVMYGRTVNGRFDWDRDDNMKMWGFYFAYGAPQMDFVTLPWTGIWAEADIADGEWHHMCAVHTGGDDAYYFYIDGEQLETDSEYFEGTPTDEETVFTMGGCDWVGVLEGLMDEAKYYNVPLGEIEIGLLAEE